MQQNMMVKRVKVTSWFTCTTYYIRTRLFSAKKQVIPRDIPRNSLLLY